MTNDEMTSEAHKKNRQARVLTSSVRRRAQREKCECAYGDVFVCTESAPVHCPQFRSKKKCLSTRSHALPPAFCCLLEFTSPAHVSVCSVQRCPAPSSSCRLRSRLKFVRTSCADLHVVMWIRSMCSLQAVVCPSHVP